MKVGKKQIDVTEEQVLKMLELLLEARDALPAINVVAAKMYNIDLTLADRIENTLEPWKE